MKLQSETVVGTQIIMVISKFFNSSSKKRDLSDQSCSGEEPKKARIGSLHDSTVSLDDVFTEGMKSPECLHILVNCRKNIKGECQLRDLVKSTEFYNEEFDELREITERKRKK